MNIKELIVKKIIIFAMLAILVTSAAAWAQGAQLPEKEKKGIKTLAEIYFPNKQVTFYKNRVFIRDNVGYVLTFEVNSDQRKVSDDGIDGRRGYEAAAALFLLRVSDYLQYPDRGPFGWVQNVTIKKIEGAK
jgi:hypothetical protein